MNAVCTPVPSGGLAFALASEIADRLSALLNGGASDSLDLRSLPLSPADRARLVELLGRGEVTATVEANGKTEIYETSYPGVWWLAHYDMHGALQMEEISISPVPEILSADPRDMEAAALRLAEALEAQDEKET